MIRPSSTFHSGASLTERESCSLIFFGIVVWNFDEITVCMIFFPCIKFLAFYSKVRKHAYQASHIGEMKLYQNTYSSHIHTIAAVFHCHEWNAKKCGGMGSGRNGVGLDKWMFLSSSG